MEGSEEKWSGPVKSKRVRDYSMGSIRDFIYRAESTEELEQIRQETVQLAHEGTISRGTLRKLDKAGKVKARELNMRLIQVVRPKLVVPRHDGLLVKP